MRRPTLIILLVMTLAIAVAGVIQLNQSTPATRFAEPSVADELPGVLRFLPAEGWTVVDSGGPMEGDPSDAGVHLAIAVTGPVDIEAILGPADSDGDGELDVWYDPRPVDSIPDEAIILSAVITDDEGSPVEPNVSFPAASLPVSLGDSCTRGGAEGAPQDLIVCVVRATVAGHWLEVRAYIGDEGSVDAAERQLWRLAVPPATSGAAS